MRIYISSSLGFVLLMAAASLSFADGPDASNYVGSKTCGICHKKADNGNQLEKWQASRHAKAFERLGTDQAKEVAKAKGIDDPQKSGACLRCHSTAYNFTETVATEKIKPEEGVTCESCHGPGKKYMAKAIMEDREKAIAAGLVSPTAKTCELCHNDQNPTWNPEKYTTKDGKKVGFDFEQAFEKIKHPDPKVKH